MTRALWLSLPALWILTIACYWPCLAGELGIMDDKTINDVLKFWDSGAQRGIPFRTWVYRLFWQRRSLTTFSYVVNDWMGGADPRVWHVTNLALHLASSTMLFMIGIHRWPSIAIHVAAIFALHPRQVDAVANAAGRSILLATFFFMAAWLAIDFGYAALGIVAWIAAGKSREDSMAFTPILGVWWYSIAYVTG